MLSAFCDWLAVTPPSLLIQENIWIVAASQSVHILAIAILACGVLAIDLRLLGLSPRGGASLAALERRFLPWIWPALLVLLATGLVLVVGEPARELLSWVFMVKMALVLVLAALTFLVQRRVRHDPLAFEATAGARLAGQAIGALSILLLAAIVTAGRWIAYVLVG